MNTALARSIAMAISLCSVALGAHAGGSTLTVHVGVVVQPPPIRCATSLQSGQPHVECAPVRTAVADPAQDTRSLVPPPHVGWQRAGTGAGNHTGMTVTF